MSAISARAPSSLYKSVLTSEFEIDSHLSDLTFRLSYPIDIHNEKLPGPLPPLPSWMLDTPMYSKLPMVPAPKGKIVLFTTGLCKKLHQTPDDLDFDPVAAGLCCEYKSLHDPHLKSHYTRQVTYDRLVKSGHITPEGMVKCSLKEFNDYHQYLKSVRLEKITQQRKKVLSYEQEQMNRKRRQSIRKDVSERDKLIKESLVKQKKARDKERKKLSRKLKTDYRKTMMRLAEQRRKKTTMQQSRRKASEEKHRTIRRNLEAEETLKKMLINSKRIVASERRADQLKIQRKREEEEKERKLEDQWERRELSRAERMMRESTILAEKKEDMYEKVLIRETKVAKHRERQQDALTRLQEERQKMALNREIVIAKKLDKKLDSLFRKYSAGPKRGRRRFPPINPKLSTNMTTWKIDKKESGLKHETSTDTGSSDRLPPISSDELSGTSIDRKRSGPPSLAIYETSSLPSVKSSEFSQQIVTIMEENEVQSEVLSTGDAPASFPEVLDSFTRVARQLVSAVFQDLKADEEFSQNVEWEAGNDGTWFEVGDHSERFGSPDVYIDAEEVSPHASLMVANALKNVVAELEDALPTLVAVPTVEERAQSIVSSVIESALHVVQPSSRIQPDDIQRTSSTHRAGIIVSSAIDGAVRHLRSEEAVKGQMSYHGDQSLDGASVNTVTLSSIIHMFEEPTISVPSITHTNASSDSESDGEEESDVVIGIVENPILTDEIVHTGGPSGDMEVDEGLHVVMHQAEDGHLVVDGAVLTAEHESQTITERILSDITLERVSGSLSGVSSTRSGLAREAPAPSISSSSSGDDEEELVREDHSSIVPIYQKNLINIGGHVVESHLSAISMKPEEDGKMPSKGKCAARNSFRNIFRPDMTYCQGSARMLRDTLVKDIKSRQTASLPVGMDMVYEVLEQEEQDIMEKHSDEALVTVEETEGLCYLPVKRKPKPIQPPPLSAPPDSQVETKSPDSTPADEDKSGVPSEVAKFIPSKSDDLPKTTSSDASGGDDAVPVATGDAAADSATEQCPGEPKTETNLLSDLASSEQKMETIPLSKSATEAKERALSAERRSTKREVSAQSVDASPNLAGSTEGSATNHSSGEDSASRKQSSRKSRMITRSSSLISGVMSRLSHVFSGTRKKSSASVPSHESSSEPASRQSSKKSVEGGALSEGAQAQDGTPSDVDATLAVISVHHGGSVHFTTATIDPPVKKVSIYASHRPQTPLPHVHLNEPLDDEEDDENEVVIEANDENPTIAIEGPSCDVMEMTETEDINDSVSGTDGHPPTDKHLSTDEAPPINESSCTDEGPPTEEAPPTIAAPHTDAPPITEATPTAEAPPTTEATPTDGAPPTTDEAPPTTEATPTEEAPPTTEVSPTDDAPPSTEATPTDEAPPTAEAIPTDDAPPTTADAPSTTEASPTEEAPPTTEVSPTDEAPPTTDSITGTPTEDVPSSSESPSNDEEGVAMEPNVTESKESTNPQTPPEINIQMENDSNNANTDSGSKAPSRLPSIRSNQLQSSPPRSQQASASSQAPDSTGSRTSQGSQRLLPPPVRSPSDRSLSGAQSMTITGRSLTPIGSKMAKSVTSTSGKEKRPSVGSLSPRAPSSGRSSRAGLSHHSRVGSPKKKVTVSSQSASKVKSAYGSTANLSVSGSRILPNKSSKTSCYSRHSSRNQPGLVSATDLGSPSRGSRSKNGSSRGSMVVPRPPSGIKPSGSAQSGRRIVRQPSGTQTTSNPTLITSQGSSSMLINHRSSNERLLPRRPSLEKENRMERLSTESVSSRKSSQEKAAKKKSSSTQPKKEESLQDQKPANPMPPIKEPLTPRPPSHPRQRSRPNSGSKKPADEMSVDADQKMLGTDQAAPEE